MPANIIERQWKIIKARLQERFAVLTQAELEAAENLDDLIGRVHLATGVEPAEIQRLIRI